MKVKHICFDKDGVLIDVHAYWSHIIEKRAELLIREYGLLQENVAVLARSMGVDVSTQKIIPGGPVGYKPRSVVVQVAIDCLKTLKVDVSFDIVMAKFSQVDSQIQKNGDYDIQVLAGVEEALKLLRQKEIRASIFSSDRKENVRKNLEQLSLIQYIDEIVGGDDVKKSKPAPEGIQLACERVGIDLIKTIYVGDTEDDMIMAKNSRCLAGVGLTTGLCDRKTLEQHTDYIFTNLKDLVLSFE